MLSSSYKRPYPGSNKRKAAKCGEDGLVFIRIDKKRAFVLFIRSWEFEVVRLPDMDFIQQDTD